MQPVIYHNPRCSKSRKTLELLTERGFKPKIIEYLETPPDTDTLARLIGLLGVPVTDIMRTGETDYEQARETIAGMDDTARIEWLASHPRVLQRPIVVHGERARIGRPPEAVLELFD